MLRRLVISLLLVVTAALLTPLSSTATPLRATGASGAAARDATPDPSFGPAARAAAVREARRQAPTIAKALGLGSRERLAARTVERDTDGTLHLRFDRTLDGLAVIGGDLVVHRSASGRILGTDFATSNPLTAVPTDHAIGAHRATEVASARQHMATGTVGNAQLVVWAVDGIPRPAWQVEVDGAERSGMPVRRVEYVDAMTGEHIAGWSEIHEAKGKGRSLYSGTVPLTTVKKKGKFLLKDTSRGNSTTVDVLNKQDGNTYLKGSIFKDADNKWGNGKASNRQSAAVDVHYGTAKTWDYFKQTFSRAGIRGNGKGAKSRVHYAKNYDNAFWDDNCFCMTYGDGGQAFKPLVSIDVAGHEMTHGVTSNTANLIYFGESGGLNEATSDIFGAMVEFKANNSRDPGDYYIGEEITKPAFGPFLRRMDQPSADGASFDCWGLTMGYNDVHYTSGPANKFFYLLAEGTGSKTIGGLPHSGTTCDGSTLSGIGKTAAAAIWYRALTVYMTSATSYWEARDATIRAALDLGADCSAVEAAWDGVDLPANFWTCAGPLDTGDSVLGSNPGFESGTAGWTFSGASRVEDNLAIGFPHSGNWWAVLLGTGSTNSASITRSVTVPSAATSKLRFSMLVYTEDLPVGDYDIVEITVNGTSLGYLSNGYANNTYIPYEVDLGAYAGQTVTLGFEGTEDFSGATEFLLDDVAVTPR